MIIETIRLGRDAELKHLQGGTAVANFSGAYNIGFGDKKRTQWIECAMWGKQAEALTQYLLKGTQFVIYSDDSMDNTDGATDFMGALDTINEAIDEISEDIDELIQ